MFFASFLDLRWSKIDLQVDFGNNFCTILDYFDPLKTPKLDPNQPENFDNKGKREPSEGQANSIVSNARSIDRWIGRSLDSLIARSLDCWFVRSPDQPLARALIRPLLRSPTCVPSSSGPVSSSSTPCGPRPRTRADRAGVTYYVN